MYNSPVWRPRNLTVALIALTASVVVVLANPSAAKVRTGTNPNSSAPHALGTTPVPAGALQIPLAGPVVNLFRGDQLNLTYEYEAVAYATSLQGTGLRFPTISAEFTQTDGASLIISDPSTNSTLTHGGYSNGVATHVSRTIESDSTLNPTVEPYLTSSQLAVRADAPYGSFRLAVRWDYTI
jgi:hypothetical protein